MNLSEHASRTMKLWTEEFQTAPPPYIDQKMVHKNSTKNVFVSRVESLGAEQPDQYVHQLVFDQNHIFFFEHAVDHVPGLLLIEAGRQAALVIAHTFYDVPFDTVFVLSKLATEFQNFVELEYPVFGTAKVLNTKYRRGNMYELQMDGNFIQKEKVLGNLSGTFTIYNKDTFKRLRRISMSS